jgi:hypothetical protein
MFAKKCFFRSLMWLIMASAFQLRTLQLSGFFGPKRRMVSADVKLEKEELFMGQVIIHIFQLLRYNAHGILEQVIMILTHWQPIGVITVNVISPLFDVCFIGSNNTVDYYLK